mmetsp:Transcript_21632/g.43351  ORF Transcript_21632/g.43351 Transcript_21632/m.43351 type:complete len:649 (+) Transcript_21632:125-2071(+)
MLRTSMKSSAVIPFARKLARRTAIGLAGTTLAGGTAVAVYTHTESGLGLKREIDFWRNITPVVWDYWWNTSFSSPKIRFHSGELFSWKKEGKEEGQSEEYENDAKKERRKKVLQSLHEKNAPKIFQIMLDLGGLYIKLGQVLSVTALPIPEEYRERFRILQSNVPGHEDFDSVILPTLEKELKSPVRDIFESIEETPCGAASIGQAHRAVLKGTKEPVVIKVQYPDAKWQVPADIECVGQFLKVCVWFGVVDESASKLSYEEFSRQFLAELDYEAEKENLKEVYESSLDPRAPYLEKGVVLPRVFDEFCTKQVITMTYLPGPKFEEEVRQQLAFLGIDTKKGIKSIVQDAHRRDVENATNQTNQAELGTELAMSPNKDQSSWKTTASRIIGNLISVDSMFSLVRLARRIMVWSTATSVKTIQSAAFYNLVPSTWEEWANERQNAITHAAQMNWTQDAVHALLDVHGHQIFNLGLFNADPHPGNILVVQDPELQHVSTSHPKIGLIDYGQCKRLTPHERVKVAKLILSIADKEPDEVIANHFRDMGIQTKNDSTRFLAEFGRLMFDSFQPKHLDHSWHKELHKEDRVLYFPKELSMVYRTALLLRGLAMSLQLNPSVGEVWRRHAQDAVRLYETDRSSLETDESSGIVV